MPDILALLDNLATCNAGPVVKNGQDCIAIRREDWEALLALRGDPEAVLARMAPIVEPREVSRMSRAEADRRMAQTGAWLGL